MNRIAPPNPQLDPLLTQPLPNLTAIRSILPAEPYQPRRSLVSLKRVITGDDTLCYLAINYIAKLQHQQLIDKCHYFFGCYIHLMLPQTTKKKSEWSAEELTLLRTLFPEFTSKKWKRMAQEFRVRGFNRSQAQCRDKWTNFVDPALNRGQWQEWQLRRLYEIHAQRGSRWSVVQQELGRTQNQIKNRFYGTLRNFIRFLLNYFDNGSCLHYQIAKMSPNFLNDLYNSQKGFSFLHGEVKNTIFLMGFKVDKKLLAQRVREKRSLYAKLHQTLVSSFQALHPQSSEDSLAHSHPEQRVGEELDEGSLQAEVVEERRGTEEVVREEELGGNEGDLPRTSQSLQNVQQTQGYYNLLMQYNQPSPHLFYYMLSYL